MDSLVDLAPGARVQGYRIERRIGAGGFGITYLATDLDEGRVERRARALNERIARYLGTQTTPDVWRRWSAQAAGPTVAIKEYFYQGVAVRTSTGTVSPARADARSEYAAGLESFLDEAHIAQDLFHPNVVTVFDVFEANNTAYYVMEYVPGETLESRVERRGRQASEAVVTWLTELLDGLGYLHARGVLHLDISPQNVILRSGGESPVLIDFGASRAVAQQKTRNFGRMVNDGYSPPEKYLLVASKLQASADVYSAGAVAAFALDGRAPPSAMLRLEDPRLAPALTEAPDQMRRAVLQALALDARKRPQSLSAWKGLGLLPKSAKPREPSDIKTAGPDDRVRHVLRTTVLPVLVPAAASLVIISGALLLLANIIKPPVPPEGRLIQEAQTLYCNHDGQGGTEAAAARATFLKNLNAVWTKNGSLAPEAAFRLGAHAMPGQGGFLEHLDEGELACGSYKSCLQAAAAGGYLPALVFLYSETGQSTLTIRRPALQRLTTSLDDWPPGLHPMDCRAKAVDLSLQEPQGS
jgi:serine/threonine protein kinase